MKTRHLFAIAAVLALFFAPALLTSGQFVYRDSGMLHEPMKRFIAAELAQGRLAEWNPHSGFGTPLVGGAVDAPLHPFNALLVALPSQAGFKAWVLASFLLGALGGVALARRLGLAPAAAAAAGLLFALSGPLVSASDNVQYLTTYAALPWYLAALHAVLERVTPLRLAGVMLASFTCAAGGDPQAWGFAMALTIPCGFMAPGGDGRAAGARRGAAALGAALVGAAPVVLPIVAWLGQSNRAQGLDAVELLRWNLHPLRLVELAVPGLFRGDPAEQVSPVFEALCGGSIDRVPWFASVYLGSGALALAALAAWRARGARVLLLSTLPFLWAAMGHRAGFGQLAARLPILRGFRFWEKLAVWPALAVALAAAWGIEVLAREPELQGRRLSRLAGGAAAALLALAALAAVPWPGLDGGVAGAAAASLAAGAVQAGAICALMALVAARLLGHRFGQVVILLLAVGDLVGGNVGAYVLHEATPLAPPPLVASMAGRGALRLTTAFTPRENRWPELNRFENAWRWGRRTLEPTWNVAAGVGNLRDYVGIRERRQDRVLRELAASGRWADAGRWGLQAVVVPGGLELAGTVGLSAPFTVLAEDPELPAWLVAVPHRDRAYLTGEVRRASEAEAQAFARIGAAGTETVVEAAVPAGVTPGDGEARIVLDLPGAVEVATRAAGPRLLVLNDGWAPGWTATVDGAPATIERANYLARGVWTPPGEHHVRFAYRTPWLRAGAILALAGLLGLAAWGAVRRRRAAVAAPAGPG